MKALSVIIPVLDEAATIDAALDRLQALRARGVELIVVDGGSSDGTPHRAAALADMVIGATRGRAHQMNAGAAQASGRVLLFLHADTVLPAGADRIIAGVVSAGRQWGRFDVDVDGGHWMLPVIAAAMNRRSRFTGIATGDQAIFVTRAAFDAVGGYPPIALMEDIALSRALLRAHAPACLRARVRTSGRRWERHGVWRTIWLMWRLRAAYRLGADPAALARRYGYRP